MHLTRSMDLCTFRSLRCSQSSSSPTVVSSSFSWSLPLDSVTWAAWLACFPAKTEAKELLSTSVFLKFQVTRSPVSLTEGHGHVYRFFLLPSLSCVLEKSLIFYISSQVQLQLYLGFPSSVPALLNPYNLPKRYMLASTAYTFRFCALVWQRGLDLAKLDSCVPCSWALRKISLNISHLSFILNL